MVLTDPTTGPREELSLAVVQGEGATEGMIGQFILPDMALTRRTAHLLVVKAADTQARRVISDSKFLRAAGTKYERLKMKFSGDTLTVDLRGVEIPVPYETALDVDDYINVENVVAGRLGEIVVLTKEHLRARALFSTANFGIAVNSSVPYTQANRANVDFFGDIVRLARYKRSIGEPFDTLVIPGPVWDFIRFTPNALAFLRNTPVSGQKEVTVTEVAAALKEWGITMVLIGDSYYNAGPDGALIYQQMWSNQYVGLYRRGRVGGNTDVGDTPNNDAGGAQIAQVRGIQVPTLGGVGCMTFWANWASRGGPMPVDAPQKAIETGLQMDGGNFVGIYWDEETEVWVCRAKVSATPYLGNPGAGTLLGTQATNASGPLL